MLRQNKLSVITRIVLGLLISGAAFAKGTPLCFDKLDQCKGSQKTASPYKSGCFEGGKNGNPGTKDKFCYLSGPAGGKTAVDLGVLLQDEPFADAFQTRVMDVIESDRFSNEAPSADSIIPTRILK